MIKKIIFSSYFANSKDYYRDYLSREKFLLKIIQIKIKKFQRLLYKNKYSSKENIKDL